MKLRWFKRTEEVQGLGIVEDGWGSAWLKCRAPECDLQVVRPGKSQCSGYCDEAGWNDR